MTSALHAVALFALCCVWQVPLLAAAAALSAPLVRRLGPAMEHRLWVAAYALAILLPALSSLSQQLGALHPHLRATAVLLGSSAVLSSDPAPAASLLHFSAPALPAIGLAYLGLLLLAVLRFARTLAATYRLLRTAQPLRLSPELDSLWRRLRQRYSVPELRLLQSPLIPGPVTLGLRRAVILLPPCFAKAATPDEVQTALAHECVHILRHDFLKNLAYQAAGCLIAFHPATWLLHARIAETREMICDAEAAPCLPTRSAYIQSLLQLATLVVTAKPPVPPPHAIGIFDANILEKRVMTLRHPAPRTSLPRRAGVLVLASASLFLTLAVAVIAAPRLTPSVAAGAAAGVAPDHVYTVGGEVSAPQLVFQVEPEFPSSAHNLPTTFQGSCLLSLTVNRSGFPEDVHILRSLSKDFDLQAIHAVQQYRFKPARLSGKAVAAAVKIEVNFQKF